ncbi:MAG: HK97 family phage prohead protease [Turicibacter sp.]|nr:HK97 family phage prohead protease [Turicibacter sp.]
MIKKELRTAQIEPLIEQDEMIVEGRALTYDSPTVLYEKDGLKYYEVIERGALDGANLSDVPFKYNHNDGFMIMARTRNKTLELIPTDEGLNIRASLANTTAGRDLYELIKRGDIDKMSFAFTVAEATYNRQTRTRHIKKIKKLYDVAAVDVPAYDDTYISARSFFDLEREKEELDNLKRRKLALQIEIMRGVKK